jgi:hypothetical protein
MYRPGRGHDPGALRIAAWPLVISIIGGIELVSGLAFYQVAQKWDSMHGLVRFLLGLVIIALSIPLIVLLFVAFSSRT